MGDPSEAIAAAANAQPARAIPSGVFILWPVMAVLALILAIGAVAMRLMAGPRFDWLLMLAADWPPFSLSSASPPGVPKFCNRSPRPLPQPDRCKRSSTLPAQRLSPSASIAA